ncbi:hypothetical protein RQP46_001936 [Phenoliferia psychrophenolica]
MASFGSTYIPKTGDWVLIKPDAKGATGKPTDPPHIFQVMDAPPVPHTGTFQTRRYLRRSEMPPNARGVDKLGSFEVVQTLVSDLRNRGGIHDRLDVVGRCVVLHSTDYVQWKRSGIVPADKTWDEALPLFWSEKYVTVSAVVSKKGKVAWEGGIPPSCQTAVVAGIAKRARDQEEYLESYKRIKGNYPAPFIALATVIANFAPGKQGLQAVSTFYETYETATPGEKDRLTAEELQKSIMTYYPAGSVHYHASCLVLGGLVQRPVPLDLGLVICPLFASVKVDESSTQSLYGLRRKVPLPIVPVIVADVPAPTGAQARGLKWMRHTFEACKDSEVTQVALWTAYRTEFEPRVASEPMLSAADVITMAADAFPSSLPCVTDGPDKRFFIQGMRARKHPVNKPLVIAAPVAAPPVAAAPVAAPVAAVAAPYNAEAEALRWMRLTYESCPTSAVNQGEFWAAYRDEFVPHATPTKPMLATGKVMSMSTQAFPSAVRRMTNDTPKRCMIYGIRLRNHPVDKPLGNPAPVAPVASTSNARPVCGLPAAKVARTGPAAAAKQPIAAPSNVPSFSSLYGHTKAIAKPKPKPITTKPTPASAVPINLFPSTFSSSSSAKGKGRASLSSDSGYATSSPARPPPLNLQTLPLAAFIEYMKTADPARAKFYDAARVILDEEAIGSDVLLRVGQDKLEKLGIKIGVASRMLMELSVVE